MFNQMSRHYEKIKEHLGLDDALAPSSEDEKDSYICKYNCMVSPYLISEMIE